MEVIEFNGPRFWSILSSTSWARVAGKPSTCYGNLLLPERQKCRIEHEAWQHSTAQKSQRSLRNSHRMCQVRTGTVSATLEPRIELSWEKHWEDWWFRCERLPVSVLVGKNWIMDSRKLGSPNPYCQPTESAQFFFFSSLSWIWDIPEAYTLWIVITPGSARITMRWSMCWRFSCLLIFVSFFSCFFCSFPSFVGSLHAALQNGVTWRAFLGILQVKHRYLSRISTLWDSKAPKSQISRFAMILHVSDHSSTIAHACCMLHAVQTSSNGLLATIQR